MAVQTTTGIPAIGTYRWHRRGWRRWTGRQWAPATYSAFPKRLHRPRDWATYPELPVPRRERLLDLAVDREVLGGARVVDRGEAGVTLAYQRTVTHLGHFVLTVLTGGLWGFVWLAVALDRRDRGKDRRVRYEVDPWGNIWPVSPGS
jgi:hypothetical protein